MTIKIAVALLIGCVSGIAFAQTAGTWSTQDYDLYSGDFNGDGKSDLLYVAKAANRASGVLLSDGSSPTVAGQSWVSNYLGIPWAANAYGVVVADFNGDGKADLFLQSSTAGDSYVLLTDANGQISAISQTIPNGAMGLAWSSGQHTILVGDFNGDGRADLFLQSNYAGGVNAVVAADANGQFSSAAPLQLWSDGYLGFNWSSPSAVVNAGDFNGDGRADLLVQAYPYYIGNSSPIYAPNMNGVAFGGSGAVPFTLNAMQAWGRGGFNADWSPLSYHLVTADFTGDGCTDVLMQPLGAGQNAYVLSGKRTGAVFATQGLALNTNTAIYASSARLIAGAFGATKAAGLYIQTTSSSGTNYFAKSIVGGIKATSVIVPVGSSSAPVTANTPVTAAPALAPIALAAVTAPAPLTNTSAGRTAAQFSVSPTGGATYNIPIWTPPGVRNIEPHLALHYTSGGPDGVMGPGWALSGLSAVARCGKTWASTGGTATVVGSPAGVTTTSSDDFCMDGNRLRVVTGYTPFCAGGTTYMTEIADFSLITACGSAGNGPAYFVVQGKDSHTYEYGNTATSTNSQVKASGATTPYAWALGKLSDRQGNTLLVTYNAGSVLSPASIQYTSNSSAGVAAGYAVTFAYTARTGGTTLTKYVAGYPVTQANQLVNINVTSGGTSVRQYLLNYGSSGTTDRPLIASVQECGGSAGTDCLRATTLNYQPGGTGWSAPATSTGLTGQYGLIPLDLNADGRPDALYGKLAGTTIQWFAKIATSGGYGVELTTGIVTSGSDVLIPGTYSGTGQVQILAPVGSTWYVYTYNGAGFTSANTSAAVGQFSSAVDYDGDGLADLEFASGTGTYVRRNVTTPGGAVAFAGTPVLIFTPPTLGTYIPPFGVGTTVPIDFNGDGRGDLLTTVSYCVFSCFQFTYAVFSNGLAAAASYVQLPNYFNGTYGLHVGDWNSDGCTDVITETTIYISNCAGGFTSLATGLLSGSTTSLIPIDWDGDGQTDFVYAANNTLYMARSTGSGIAVAVPLGIAAPTTTSLFTADHNSDGQQDLMFVDSAASYAVGYYPHNGVNTPPDLASSITDGFGINFSPTYVPISQNNYSKYNDAPFPEIDFQGPMYVVNQFTASDGTGGTYNNQFWYYGARLNLQGRGFEGFYAARKFDSRNSVYQYSYYRRDFPFTGSIFEQDTYQPDAATLMARTINNYNYTNLGGSTACNPRCFPYVTNSTTTGYEVTGAKKGLSTSNTVTNYAFDLWGNLTNTTATTADTDAVAPASPFNGQSWITTIANVPVNDTSGNWCLGRPSSSTTQKTAPGQPALTRTVAHTVDPVQCRANDETVEPGTALEVKTTFGFDGCGNTNSVSVVGKDRYGSPMPARTTGTSYGTRCQFAELVTNPLGQSATTAYRYDLGVPSSSTDANGNSVSWLYDNFARKTRENSPDGTFTTMSYSDCVAASCWGVPDLRFLTYEYAYSSSSSQLRAVAKFYDGLDRVRYEEGNRALGTWTNTMVVYDSLGRKTAAYLPWSAASNGYHTYDYDIGNRVTADKLYTSGGAFYRSISMQYAGQTVTVTDPKGFPITKVTDVAGNMRRVTDPNNNGTVAGTTQYTYDSFGNLVTLVDATTKTSSYTYNIRGFKTAAADADTGVWNFVPNSLNELVSQTDAKSQTTTFGYDLLSRMTSRVEPESPTATTWVFGTNPVNHNVGKLLSLAKPDGYAESYVYDSIGRPQTVTYTEDGVSYPFDYTYNALGTVDTLIYPQVLNCARFTLKSVYDAYGYLNQVKDNSTGSAYWTLNAVNDSSLPTSETLGNGVAVATGYTPWTNEMTSRSEGVGGSLTSLQNLSYAWDLSGNLERRVDVRQSNLTEIFTLDAMNRIKTATLNGSQSLSMAYDAAGNIVNKSDVSASPYDYGDAAHPHAVTTAGSWALAYDANGNMSSRAGSALSWYSYNLPNLINYGSSFAQFSYNANHQRWKQVANYGGTLETTHYIGGLLEILQRGSAPTEYRHQIPAGSSLAVFTRRSDNTSATYYATSDHLGSADLVLDATATVLTRESYTPFGARRGSNWQGLPTTADYTAYGNTTRRGFTGHEMLDSVSLVHMNGRVYDPYLGRFTSADTVIQNLAVTASINPFSYAWNDPLRYTDPSGHSLLDVIGAIIGIVVAIFFPQIMAFLGFHVSLTGVALAMVSGFVGGFVGALIATGSLSAALMSGVLGAMTAGLFYGVGSLADGFSWTTGTRVLAHAAVGCAQGELSGGNCGKGAAAAALGEAATRSGFIQDSGGKWGSFKAAAEAGAVGGVASAITGGKFVEGFSTAAAGYLFNDAAHNRQQHLKGVAEEAAHLQTEGYTILGSEVGASIDGRWFGGRFYDLVVEDKSGAVFGVEVKTTRIGAFRLDPKQVAFDVQVVRSGAVTKTGLAINGVMYRGTCVACAAASAVRSLTQMSALKEANVEWSARTSFW
jgi:RHS repeat-associated protein